PALVGIEVQILKAVDQIGIVLALTKEIWDPLPLSSFFRVDCTPPGGLLSRI
ncbi:unnamed protein product, partial [Brachionus calyciflorus]